MIEKIEIEQKICDGCGAVDNGYHTAAGHYTTSWSNIKGFDVCKLCEAKLEAAALEKLKVNVIEDILLSIKMSQPEGINTILKTFGTFRPLASREDD